MRCVVLGIVLCGAVGCGGGGGGSAWEKPGGPPPKTSPVVVENHADLIQLLRHKGLDVVQYPAVFGGDPAVLIHLKKTEKSALCALAKTPRDAAEAAGIAGDGGFAWGRFVFLPGKAGDPSLVPDIRAAVK